MARTNIFATFYVTSLLHEQVFACNNFYLSHKTRRFLANITIYHIKIHHFSSSTRTSRELSYKICMSIQKYHSKWFEPRIVSSSYSMIVRVSVVLRRTVVGDWRFNNLSGSHLQSQVNSVCQSTNTTSTIHAIHKHWQTTCKNKNVHKRNSVYA